MSLIEIYAALEIASMSLNVIVGVVGGIVGVGMVLYFEMQDKN